MLLEESFIARQLVPERIACKASSLVFYHRFIHIGVTLRHTVEVPRVIVFVMCVVPFLSACAGSGNRPVAENFTAIQHTVFLINENHTFDNYFGTFPGADGTTTGLLSTGQWIPLSYTSGQLSGRQSLQRLGLQPGGDGRRKMDKFDVISGGTWSAYTQATPEEIAIHS